ncbi:MAG: glycine zipper 2TM domain-containing protein [Alphaproteobacteria bacterium]|nr:glycine zipper 2TM domain-containing protein [Alphaproteobacteria bacterium]
MKRFMLLAPVLAAALALTACQSDSWGQKQTAGTLGGAALGGLLGNQFGGGTGKTIFTATGVLLGAWLGNEIGTSLDSADRNQLRYAETRAYSAPVGEQIVWNNPQSGNYGSVTPVRDGYTNTGAYCREFQQTITVGGKVQEAFGRACQQPDGSWKIVQ